MEKVEVCDKFCRSKSKNYQFYFGILSEVAILIMELGVVYQVWWYKL